MQILGQPNPSLQFSLLYLPEKMTNPICLPEANNTYTFMGHYDAIGYNGKQQDLETFHPNSEKVWASETGSIIKAHELRNKNASVCLVYLGGPLTFTNPKTGITKLIGIALDQTPKICRGDTNKRIRIEYQDVS